MRPSWTRVFASYHVSKSSSTGPCSLLTLSIFCYHVSLRNFTLSYSCRFWACKSALAFSWLAVSILIAFAACTITVNYSHLLSFNCNNLCLSFFLLYKILCFLTVSNNNTVSTFKLGATNALPALLERAALICLTSLRLVDVGSGLPINFTSISYWALLGRGFSCLPRGMAKQVESA